MFLQIKKQENVHFLPFLKAETPAQYHPGMTDPLSTRDEPMPDGDDRDVASLVQSDLEERAQEGKREYGECLSPNNGRKALVDAYQEALDLVMYLRQKIAEDEIAEDVD